MSRTVFTIKNIFFIEDNNEHFSSFKNFVESNYDVIVHPINIDCESFLSKYKPITHTDQFEINEIRASQKEFKDEIEKLNIDLFLIDKELDRIEKPNKNLGDSFKNLIADEYFYLKITGPQFQNLSDEIAKPTNSNYNETYIGAILNKLNSQTTHLQFFMNGEKN